MLMKGAGESDVYSDREAAELIFKLFGHLVLGGNICQVRQHSHPACQKFILQVEALPFDAGYSDET